MHLDGVHPVPQGGQIWRCTVEIDETILQITTSTIDLLSKGTGFFSRRLSLAGAQCHCRPFTVAILNQLPVASFGLGETLVLLAEPFGFVSHQVLNGKVLIVVTHKPFDSLLSIGELALPVAGELAPGS